jgi:hypothetical protein
MDDVPVFGEPPELTGKSLQALLAESFVCAGQLVASANAVFIKSGGRWYRLVLDAGTVHWKEQFNEPQAWSVPASGWSYPHRDLMEELGLSDATVSNVSIQGAGAAVRLEFAFSNGRRLVLLNGNDSTSYHVA